MKKRFLFVLVLISGISFFAFQQRAESKKPASEKRQSRVFRELIPQQIKATAMAISPRVSSLKPAGPENGEKSNRLGKAEKNAREIPNKLPYRKQIENYKTDETINPAEFGAGQMPSPEVSFEGLSSNDNAAAYGFRILPPDTIGDVGLNHYVQAVNALFRVFDKQGNPLTPPLKLNSLFKPLGTVCATRNDGDPIVLYDSLADRWLLSQFCKNAPPFRQMIAVSKTGDPTGEYFVYEFVMPNIKLNDYSKIGVWPDGYYMSTDEFLGGDYAGSGAFAFEREKMLVGDPTASYVYFDLASPTTMRIGGILPTDLDGLNPPPDNSPNVFIGYTATEYGDPEDALRLFEFDVDFKNPENSTFAEVFESPIAVAPFDPTSPQGRNDIDQPVPGEDLDSQSDRLMYRATYRKIGNIESIVVNQTVRSSPVGETYRAGVRVYELKRSVGGGSNEYAVSEQATIGDNQTSRFMAAAAQDHEGNIAVGYTTSNEEKQPSIVYTGKLATTQTGVFRNEALLTEGTGVQTAFGFRWGDYSGMNSDPADGCSFWITNQYYSLQSQNESPFGWLTRIGKFRFSECSDEIITTIEGTVTNSLNGLVIDGAKVKVNNAYSRFTSADGTYRNLKVVGGNYNFTVSAKGFRTKEMTLNIGGAGTFIQDFSLEPIAVLENEKTQITAESCAVNNTVEPSETVTLNIPLRNTGAINTENLTATLLSNGTVQNPSGSQNYGALPVNGASVVRPFTFTAAQSLNCGDEIVLQLQLEDGKEDLGIVEIRLRTGRINPIFSENFDTVNAPDLPSGWTTSFEGTRENWITSTDRAESIPNTAFSPAPRTIGVNQIVSPVISITSTEAELSFRNWYELETTFLRNRVYDGAVLEIKIGAGDWEDILDAGGIFLTGGYNDGLIDGCCSNPLVGRRAWSGRSGINTEPEFIDSAVKLPTTAAGHDVQFRWRVATDNGSFREGQYIDGIRVTDGFICDCVNTPQGNAPFDFDGDGKTDLSVFRPSDNSGEADFLIQQSSNDSNTGASWGSTDDLAVNADYDGDGKTDYAIFRPSNRTWFILNSADNLFTAVNFGLTTDKLTPADFDGDRKADIAVYRQAEGTWYILQSLSGAVRIQQFGIAEDKPVQADFDGDGKVELAVYRPSAGVWYASRSSDGGFTAVQFGIAEDRPLAGDFDGDNQADFVVYRPSERIWYLLKSTEGFTAVQFGLSDDKPLQTDFDGDGKRDIAVYRPGEGVWYYLKSSDGGFVAKQFGINTDTAVPSIFVP
jgi:hypothetical protein